jgi:alpha-mannosidase
VELCGEGLAFSAAKPSDEGAWLVLRCVNLTNEDREGLWRLAAPVHEAQLARLDETALESIPLRNGEIPFRAGPFGIVTVLVR